MKSLFRRAKNFVSQDKPLYDEVIKQIQFKTDTNPYEAIEGCRSYPIVETTSIEPGTRILVMAPHQDDEVLGCGGTICLYARQGGEVKVLYMTDGSYGGIDDIGSELAQRRKIEAKAGLRELGLQDAVFLDRQDTNLICDPKTVKEVLRILNEFQPNKIFVPFYFELHPDHFTTGLILAKALQSYANPIECYCYEVWTPIFPNLIVDMSSVLTSR